MNKAFLEKTDREKVIKVGTEIHLKLINYLTSKEEEEMKEKESIKCAYCGREKTFSGEGHFIDGSWAEDKLLGTFFGGQWVCCFDCYMELVIKAYGFQFYREGQK